MRNSPNPFLARMIAECVCVCECAILRPKARFMILEQTVACSLFYFLNCFL